MKVEFDRGAVLTREAAIALARSGVPETTNEDAVDRYMLRIMRAIDRDDGAAELERRQLAHMAFNSPEHRNCNHPLWCGVTGVGDPEAAFVNPEWPVDHASGKE